MVNYIALIFLSIYVFLCLYVGYNGWIWITKTFPYQNKILYTIFILFLSISPFFGRFFSSKLLAYINGIWMVIIGYSIILLPLANIVYFLTKKQGASFIGFLILGYFIFIFTYGSYLAWNPVVRTYELTVEKPASINELKILLVSDLHIGKLIGENHMEKLVAITEGREPDMVIIAGDIIDDVIHRFLADDIAEILRKLTPPLGVYATTGNHDYYGGDLNQLIEEVEKAGVIMLQDQVIEIEESFYLIGRNDPTDRKRKSIVDLVKNLDKNKPLIMIDHQPTEIQEAQEHGVDVLLSGHTHRGQVAPAHWITKRIYLNDYGYKTFGQLHSIVTSGFGFWGPPFRLGSQAEVVELIIRFQE